MRRASFAIERKMYLFVTLTTRSGWQVADVAGVTGVTRFVRNLGRLHSENFSKL